MEIKKKLKKKKKGYGPPRSRRFEWSCMNIMQHGGKKSIVVNKSPNVKRNKSPSQILDGFDIDEESLRHTWKTVFQLTYQLSPHITCVRWALISEMTNAIMSLRANTHEILLNNEPKYMKKQGSWLNYCINRTAMEISVVHQIINL